MTSEDRRIETEAARWFGFHDRGLTPAQKTELAAWLGADERHRKAFSMFRAASQSFDQLSQLRPPGEPDPEVVLRPGFRTVSLMRIALPLTAAAAIAFGCFLVWRPAHFRIDPLQYSESFATDVGQLSKISLPDGSEIELNTSTALAVAFNPAERRVRLARGEAHFSVAKNPARPFVVEASGVAVRAVGTAFDVRLRSETVEVLVTEGKVRVDDMAKGHSLLPSATAAIAAAHASTGESAEPVLGAGERAVIPIGPNLPSGANKPDAVVVASVASAQVSRLLSWQQRRLYFDPAPLSEVIAEFNRYNRHKLVLDDAATGSVRVGGSFQADDYKTFVRLLESSFGITSETRGDETVLRLPH